MKYSRNLSDYYYKHCATKKRWLCTKVLPDLFSSNNFIRFHRSQSSKTPDKSAEKKNKQKNTSEKATVENSKASQEQTYPNGLVVEDLKLGKPNGKQATPGKQVY